MAELPVPVRAALGLVATVADAIREGRGLPEGFADELATKALELPVQAVSTALQLSLRAQQQYAAMTVRGDELLTQLRGGPPAEPPAWAQFDDGPAADARPTGPAAPPQAAPEKSAAKKTTARKVATKKAPAKKAAAKKAPAKTPLATTPPTPVRATRAVPAPRTGKPSAFDLVGGDPP